MNAADQDPPDSAALVDLPRSTDPVVVFAGMVAQSVPAYCDDCTVDVVDGARTGQRVVTPRGLDGGGLLRLADRAAATATHRVTVPFSGSGPPFGDTGTEDVFHGSATFVWHRRIPTLQDRTLAAVLVRYAVRSVEWQRNAHAVRALATKAANLELALHSNRRIGAAIGILMSLHKINDDEAFDLLRRASQRSNRKLHDLALEVIDTGWLDPDLAEAAPGSRRP